STRCPPPPERAPRQTRDAPHHQLPTRWPARRPGRTGPTRPHPVAPPRRRAGLLRPPRLQRTHRSHQRASGSPSSKRPGIPQSHPLPTALTAALRQPRTTDQCTLKPEEPELRLRFDRPFGLADDAAEATRNPFVL